MSDTLLTCPKCNGRKQGVAFCNTGADSSEHYATAYQCTLCDGSGHVSKEALSRYEQLKIAGKAIRQLRVSNNLFLKEFAEMLGVTTSELSKAEFGVFNEDQQESELKQPEWELETDATHWSIQCNALVKAAHGCVLRLSRHNPNHWLLTKHLETELNDTTKFMARPMRGEEL